MQTGAKIALSLAAVAVACFVMIASSRGDSAGSHSLWRGGKNDAIRNLLFRSDGSLRKHTKASFFLFMAGWLFTLWVVVP